MHQVGAAWTLKPDGPHDVPLGKVRRVAPILKVGGS